MRAGGTFGQLLLVVVLALGVFVMHTLGHPADEHCHTGTPGIATIAVSHTVPLDEPHDGSHGARSPASTAADETTNPTSSHEPAMAMDMLSLCVAVLLSAWLLAALLRSAFARRAEWAARLLARLTAAQRPDPPPRTPDLTQLSVLRL